MTPPTDAFDSIDASVYSDRVEPSVSNNEARVSTSITIPTVTLPAPPNSGGSGGGGGGGATTPWMLLGLLALLSRRKFVRFRAWSAHRPEVDSPHIFASGKSP